MLELTSARYVEEFFSQKPNATASDESIFELYLGDTAAKDLRELQSQGKKIYKTEFISDDLKKRINAIYWQDYNMLSELDKLRFADLG